MYLTYKQLSILHFVFKHSGLNKHLFIRLKYIEIITFAI